MKGERFDGMKGDENVIVRALLIFLFFCYCAVFVNVQKVWQCHGGGFEPCLRQSD